MARQVLTRLIDGRIVFTPDLDTRSYAFEGTATLGNLLKGIVLPKSGQTLRSVWRPQRDSNPRFGLERGKRECAEFRANFTNAIGLNFGDSHAFSSNLIDCRRAAVTKAVTPSTSVGAARTRCKAQLDSRRSLERTKTRSPQRV